MIRRTNISFWGGIVVSLFLLVSCKEPSISAKELLGNAKYQAISYGGYRENTRKKQPTIDQIKEDLLLLNKLDIKVLRTYNVHLPHAENVLKSIQELKQERDGFEMYVMLGAWIDCKNAWTGNTPNHREESSRNKTEINKAVSLAKKYPEIVKIIAVGNEAMVHWANYHVKPDIILKWVLFLQELKAKGQLSKDLWVTSSDDFASWGGGGKEYHTKSLEELVKAVDYISMHTYPMHNTYYHPSFWTVPEQEKKLSNKEQVDKAMLRALHFAQKQYDSVKKYMESIGVKKPISIGETGWATASNGHYSSNESRAADEYKAGTYYKLIRDWTIKEGITCFYFEGFDESWKDAQNPQGSENHFGLFNLKGQAKYAIWESIDDKRFKGLTRDGNTIQKTHQGNLNELLKNVLPPHNKNYKGFNQITQ